MNVTIYNIYHELKILHFKYILKTYQTFLLIIKFIKVIDLVSTTLEGSSTQPRVLSLQILLSYQMLQPITLTNIVTVCLNTHIPKNVEQPSDICVQFIANPHCSHLYSRCSSACRKISAAEIVEQHLYAHA